MQSRKRYSIHAVNLPVTTTKRAVRKHLNADTLIALLRKDFQKIPDSRAGNATISIDDALMSALAMFQLKDPSLLAFDKRRREGDKKLLFQAILKNRSARPLLSTKQGSS